METVMTTKNTITITKQQLAEAAERDVAILREILKESADVLSPTAIRSIGDLMNEKFRLIREVREGPLPQPAWSLLEEDREEFLEARTRGTQAKGCPCCGHHGAEVIAAPAIFQCPACLGIYGEVDDRERVLVLVNLNEMQANCPSTFLRYFDFTYPMAGGTITRTHGFFDIRTKKVVQFG